MNSSSGRLEDVGDVGWYCLPRVRVNASERPCLGHPFLKHHEVREIQRRRSRLWIPINTNGKVECRNCNPNVSLTRCKNPATWDVVAMLASTLNDWKFHTIE